ncbi:MAG: Wzy polymerase domain-containing protein [Burkholderiaceae bacterium]
MTTMTLPSAHRSPISRTVRWGLVSAVAIAVPMLFAPTLPPSPTLFNQAFALFGWGAMLAMFAQALPTRSGQWETGLRALVTALLLVLAANLASPLWTGLPYSIALTTSGAIAAALLAAIAGAALQRAGAGQQAFRAVCIGIVVAAAANAMVAVVQVYATSWADGAWIAGSSPIRATGNLRQSNHLCTLLFWGIVAVLWLGETGAVRKFAVAPIALLLMFGVMLSGSRMGIVGALLLAAWGLLDRSLSRNTRIALLLAPIVYGLMWAGGAVAARSTGQVFGGTARYDTGGVLSTTRYAYWANLFDLIREVPWWGVGSGELNFAWTLTPFSNRSGEPFDHAHNLPLHFAVELGLPLAAVVLGLLGWAICVAAINCFRSAQSGSSASPARPALAMLVFVLLHSLLEYPLWHTYFLLPTAFAIGLCLGQAPQRNEAGSADSRPSGPSTAFRSAALLLMLGAAFSVLDYFRVVPMFTPHDDSSLQERIASGQKSMLFSHHADYAAATYLQDPQVRLKAIHRAAHNLLDSRLLISYANALHATGDTERAKYVAQRLLEFDTPQYPVADAKVYFAACRDLTLKDADRPYQCFAPQRKFTFADFR